MIYKRGEDITLEQGQSGMVTYPFEIKSGGLSPCIAIGILDKKKRQGYMFHEANAHVNEIVPSFIEEVLKESEKDDLIIKVTGGEITDNDDPEIKEYTQESRNYVRTELEKVFDCKQITYKWNNLHRALELILPTEEGEFFIEETDY